MRDMAYADSISYWDQGDVKLYIPPIKRLFQEVEVDQPKTVSRPRTVAYTSPQFYVNGYLENTNLGQNLQALSDTVAAIATSQAVLNAQAPIVISNGTVSVTTGQTANTVAAGNDPRFNKASTLAIAFGAI